MSDSRENKSGTGYLTFKTRTAQSALPVENVRITVSLSEAGNTAPIATVISDRNGNTERIELPAPPRMQSMSPGFAREPFSRYNVRAEADGFYTSEFFGAPVFEGVTSVQTVNLIPLAEYTPEPFGTRFYESAPDSFSGR